MHVGIQSALRSTVALTLLASVATVSACSNTNVGSGSAPVTSSLSLISGSPQAATVGTAAGAPIVVQVKDQNGNNVSGVAVTFSASGGSSVTSASAVTDAQGMASTGFTVANIAGADTITAHVAGLAALPIPVTGLPGAASVLAKVSGDTQTVAVSTSLGLPLVVQARDQFGNAVPGVSVTYTTTGGTLTGAAATTDNTGTASATLKLPAAPGVTTVTATITGSSPAIAVTFTATGT
ncbi:MAG TPA: Ig-like domain-containing protein [Gemmatimonadales bacterium]|jgi:adhesin/invasin